MRSRRRGRGGAQGEAGRRRDGLWGEVVEIGGSRAAARCAGAVSGRLGVVRGERISGSAATSLAPHPPWPPLLKGGKVEGPPLQGGETVRGASASARRFDRISGGPTRPRGCGNRVGRSCRLFSSVRFDSGACNRGDRYIRCKRNKNSSFLVDEMSKSRKLVHIIYRSISIADTGVGARDQPSLWNREQKPKPCLG